ncbi:beta-galactosidase [Paenactinomyces guangxiensis]|uniref:Beta-galactosidase n=1 Tax=Paenactinomyces guangxiensis TaxID=1490290 RepID=A0A7W1WPS6_9BACL|nr:beta-galactosidase [Paenactinomyces guangxiensis]MBA4493785.1 beta-galactosidase [Paenactinomyces guangxiensis]MBH8591074.1 beta-galactosidase [Paenactinomyces guangxiensis]
MKNKLYYGAAYYPELWNSEVIEQDIQEMLRLGINVVRIGEFAWSRMEPEMDLIDLGFFRRILDRFHAEGIDVIFCTPTPTPPIWMTHGHPERLHVNAEGKRMSHGSRQHCCMNHPFFRERCRIIVENIAKELGRHPALIGWQIDNEFHCHVGECFCDTCKSLWPYWLQGKYETIEALNDAWGTDVWSERYLSFDQVPQPIPTPFYHHASLTTAYQMFAREKVAEFLEEQADIIRKYSDAPITHNTNRAFKLDNERMFKRLDFASFDDYPDCDSYEDMLLNYDLFRNVKPGVPFWVMETSTSHNGHLHGYMKPHRNGFLEVEAVAAYAFGAGGFNHWLWRQQRSGCEMTHGSVLSAWGEPSVGYPGVQAVSKVRQALEPLILKSEPQQAEVAMTYSDRARVFLSTESLDRLNYLQLVNRWHSQLMWAGLHRDLIFEEAVLDGYKLWLTPFVPYLPQHLTEKGLAFAKQGGIWIVGPLTGYRTGEHTVPTNAALGELERICSFHTRAVYPISGTNAQGVAFGVRAPLGYYSAVFDETSNTRTVGWVEGGVTPGAAFIQEVPWGAGKIVLVGSTPQGKGGDEMLRAMFCYYADKAGVSLRFHSTQGTVVAPRVGEGRIIWVVVNMDGNGGSLELPCPADDLLNGGTVPAGPVRLETYEYRVFGLHS